MVNRNFLYKILKILGIDKRVMKFFETIYMNTDTSIQVNSHFKRRRGVTRQGCPLSPTLYALCPCVHNTSHKINSVLWHFPSGRSYVQHADDLVLFCRDKSDQDYIFSFFDKAAIAAGSTLHMSIGI